MQLKQMEVEIVCCKFDGRRKTTRNLSTDILGCGVVLFDTTLLATYVSLFACLAPRP